MDQFSYVGIQYVDFAQYLGMLFCLLGPQNIELPTDSELPALPDGMGKMSLKHIAKSMIGLAIRYVELQLFGYLQRVSNETCFEDDEDQHAYILCLLRTLTPIPTLFDMHIKVFGLVSSTTDGSFRLDEPDHL